MPFDGEHLLTCFTSSLAPAAFIMKRFAAVRAGADEATGPSVQEQAITQAPEVCKDKLPSLCRLWDRAPSRRHETLAQCAGTSTARPHVKIFGAFDNCALLLQEVETSRYRMEEGDGTSHAQIIVKELYLRYQKQLQRWRDYRNLFFFLAFVALFLAVLYTQRQANTAYQVHATMGSVLLPSDTVSYTRSASRQWLSRPA